MKRYTEVEVYEAYVQQSRKIGNAPMTMEGFNEALTKKISDIRQSGGKQSSKMKLAKTIANTGIKKVTKTTNMSTPRVPKKKDPYAIYQKAYESFKGKVKKKDKDYDILTPDSRKQFERFMRNVEGVNEATIRKHAYDQIYEYSDKQARHYKSRVDEFRKKNPTISIPQYTLDDYRMYGGEIVEKWLSDNGVGVSGSQLWGSN